MQQVGEVISLFISNKELSQREKVNSIELDTNGIINDKFYAKDKNRSVLITSIDSYKMAKDKNIDLEYGLLGENLLIDYNPYSLTPKSQLLIGEVVLEIVQNCTICKSLTKIDNKLPKLLKDDRGVFAKVIKSGLISDGDKIYLKKELAIS
ncbi:MAG TPA: MOSC domain-containing protein [Campylobacterales bacterium]|jgi:MOSC domain-containing protein YiiM|nr:MOSC domain-containing protein [Campylobacterales bacterium]HHH51196.1 MOSC domain-containing protein [Campylobacterales bacterium]